MIAVDGSTAYLIDKEPVKAHFGTHGNHFSEVSMAGVMKFYDVLNKILVFLKIYPIKTEEKTIVAVYIEKIPENSLSLYDRGFASYSLMYLLIHQEKTKHFVMRCKQEFNKEVILFMQSSDKDLILNISPNYRAIHKMKQYGFRAFTYTTIKIRMAKVVLNTGETEVLLTNLYDQEVYKTKQIPLKNFIL
nr:hypothetical protein [uncultured Flavobacterium sp.]